MTKDDLKKIILYALTVAPNTMNEAVINDKFRNFYEVNDVDILVDAIWRLFDPDQPKPNAIKAEI